MASVTSPTPPAAKKPAAAPSAKPAARKPAAKSTPKPASKTPANKSATPTKKKARAAAKPETPAAPKSKNKLVRDSFTIPKSEYAVLGTLKQRANGLTHPAKNSELLRAGIKALASMRDTALLAALGGVPTIKTGRPAAKAAQAPKVGKAQDAAADKR